MKCIILAAGYATRLYPLTKDKPKSLLQVGGRTILDRILDNVERVPDINEVIIVSNHKFYCHFSDFANSYQGKPLNVINDGSTANDNRLGAIKDILIAVETTYTNEDIMVLAGDNLFDFELSSFVDYYKKKGTDCITAHIMTDIELLRRTGVAELNQECQVMSFEEKPKHPKSQFAVPPFYIYRDETIPMIKQFIEEGNNGDAPGMLISWLSKQIIMHAYLFDGNRYDIGTLSNYYEAQNLYNIINMNNP